MRHIVLAVQGSIFREGLKSLFEREQWRVNTQVLNRQQLVPTIKPLIDPLVIVSDDFCAQGLRSMLRSIKDNCPRAKVLLWCHRSQRAIELYMSGEAIDGYLYQNCKEQEWLTACSQINHGGYFHSPYLAQTFRYLGKFGEHDSPFANLSKRERLVFQMICSGCTVADISERLFISRKTVNTFRYRLFKKTNVLNDVQLAHLAISEGYVPVTPNQHEPGKVANEHEHEHEHEEAEDAEFALAEDEMQAVQLDAHLALTPSDLAHDGTTVHDTQAAYQSSGGVPETNHDEGISVTQQNDAAPKPPQD